MLRPIAVAAVALLVTSSASPAAITLSGKADSATAAAIKTALTTGALDEGLKTLEPLASGGDTEAAFGVGAITLTLAIEHFTQTLYRHGFSLPDNRATGMIAPPIPQNPNPEPFDYDGVRDMLSTFLTELDAARASFEVAAKSGDYVIEINPLEVRIDANGDGTIAPGESLAGLIAMWSNSTVEEVLAPPTPDVPKFEYVGFDRADAYWLAGYTDVLAAQADFLLAHDFSSFVNAAFHRLFPKAGFPMQDFAAGGSLMFDPETDTGIADLIAAIHTINWPVADAARLAGVRDRMKAVLAYSRQNWDAILAESDDNHELLPSPKQTAMIPDAAITDDKVAAWRATLDEADRILDGTLLIPHWRFKQGFDLKAYFETAKSTDLVMLLTGAGALPFLKDGEIANPQNFEAIQTAFGNDWLGYAFWFN